MPMYDEIFAVALVVSAFLAMHIEETIYAVISFGVTLTLLSGLYFLMNAPFAAVFQLIVAVGAIAVFFLAGEMLTPKKRSSQKMKDKIIGLLIAAVLAVPPVILELRIEVFSRPYDLAFASALWEFRALDVIAQSIVILMLALGIVMVLRGKGGK